MSLGNLRRRAAVRALAALIPACAVSLVLPALAASGPTHSGDPTRLEPRAANAGPYVPGEAIVRFERSASAASRRAARNAADVELEEAVGVPRAQLVEVEGSVPGAVRRLERQPGVAYAQPNFRYEATAVSKDTFSEQLWGLSDPVLPEPGVYVEEAWKTSRGNGQAIAVLDTGVDLTHPDLAPNLWLNSAEQAGTDDVDDDGNEKIDDIHGFDFVDEDGDPDDYEFHGTHVAGTAAAVADNELGIAGVAPEAEIMAVRVLNGDGEGKTSQIAAGIEYAAENGAEVINMSLGGPAGPEDQLMEDAIEAATDAVVVVAAGNDGVDNEDDPHSPCVLPQANLICVAALNKAGTLAGFSNYGTESVDIAAPGTSILSAKTDYGVPVFADGFEGEPSLWSTAASNGGKFWGLSSSAATGVKSATDSLAGNYGAQEVGSKFLAASELFTTDPVSLAGERGCRVHFNAKYEIQSGFDVFLAGAEPASGPLDAAEFDGQSFGYPGSFTREEVSVSGLDGQAEVHPFFGVFSDEKIQLDGAYVDDVRLICRDQSYVDAEATSGNYDQAESGNYVRFAGTSMATPHVAGVAALVRAAASALGPGEVIAAVLDGASAIPTFAPGRRTVTEGIADACKAVAIATEGDIATDCPASSEPVPQPPDQGGTVPPAIPVTPDTQAPTPFDPAGAANRAPRTFFLRRPAKLLHTEERTAKAVFRLGSNEAGVTFLCKLDRARFRFCGRTTVRRVALGPHVFRVKARDADGNTDRTPAVYRFRVTQAS